MIKVLIADDHALLSESLKYVLQQDKEIEVVGLAQNGLEAVELSKKLLPDLVLMDIKMSECDGLKASEILKECMPQLKIVVLTTFEDKENIYTAVKLGLDGYILKDMRPHELILAIKCIHAGFYIMDRTAKNIFLKEFLRLSKHNTGELQDNLKLEDLEIIKLIAKGKSNREIAQLLNYSEGTIKNKVSRLMDILEVKDRTQLVVKALEDNLI